MKNEMTNEELLALECVSKTLDDLKEFGEIQIFKTLSLGICDFLRKNIDELSSLGLDKFQIFSPNSGEQKDMSMYFPNLRRQPIVLMVAFNDETAKFMFNLLLRK